MLDRHSPVATRLEANLVDPAAQARPEALGVRTDEIPHARIASFGPAFVDDQLEGNDHLQTFLPGMFGVTCLPDVAETLDGAASIRRVDGVHRTHVSLDLPPQSLAFLVRDFGHPASRTEISSDVGRGADVRAGPV